MGKDEVHAGDAYKVLTGYRWIRYVIAEAIDIEGRPLGQSKVVQTIPPDRNAEKFVEEQEWLEEHMPSVTNDNIQGTSKEGYHADTDTQTQHESYQADTERWDETMSLWQNAKLLAYMAGFFTCFLACWMGACLKSRFRRTQRTQGYTQVDKDDREDDYELDEAFGQVDDPTSHTNRSNHYVNGRIYKEEG